MNDITRTELLKTVISGGMQSFDRAITICRLLMDCAHICGDVCEFGCFEGHTALLMRTVTEKKMWLYDSFEGLPEPGPFDGKHPNYQRGAMKANPFYVREMFDNLQYPEPKMIEKPFSDLQIYDIPDYIAFAHIDADLHYSIRKALELIWPFMSTNGIIVIDDYRHPDLPGVKDAVDEFCIPRTINIHEPCGVGGKRSLHVWIRK